MTPEASMSHIQVPPGFRLELFAQEPMIVNPINMNWDHRGRLWVIETIDYPNSVREEEGSGDDSIKILEDTNSDSKADKVTVFADKLNIPTSMVFVNGGVLVSQAPHFLFLKDTDGDDKADIREIVMTGWGVTDTHAGPSNLRYGFDNRIWGTVGYSGFNGQVGGKQYNFEQVLYNFSRDFVDLKIHSNTTNNTWGLGFTENFDIFISTANNTHSAFASIPAKYMRRVKGFGRDVVTKLDGHYFMHPATENFRQVDVFGGFTAAAGHAFYTARTYPREYWNRVAFVSEPTGHLLHRAIIEPFGSGFLEKDGWNLLASSDEWVSPVQAEVGPDGNVWILDWYNFIVQHNPTPEGFENGLGNAHINPLRDKDHGRIYRLIYEGGTNSRQISLNPEDPSSLLDGLKNDNLLWRLHAQRLIVENNYADLESELIALITSSNEDEIGLNPAAVHAIWSLNGLGISSRESLDAIIGALDSKNSGIRKAAVQALPVTDESIEQLLKSGVINDEDLNTRLAAIIKTLDLPESMAVGQAIFEQSRSLEAAQDLWLSKALQAAGIVHKKGFVWAYEKFEENIGEEGLTRRIYLSYNTENFPLAAEISTLESTKGIKTPDIELRIQAVLQKIEFDKDTLEVKSGQLVSIVFENPDFMQHNLLVVTPGNLEVVGSAADAMVNEADAAERNYVPNIPEVLFSTRILNPNEQTRLTFKAPKVPGSYPFVCTFPGHWRTMNGILIVK